MLNKVIDIGKHLVHDPSTAKLWLNVVLDMKGSKSTVGIPDNLFYIYVQKFHFTHPNYDPNDGHDRVNLSRTLNLNTSKLLDDSESNKIRFQINNIANTAINKLSEVHKKKYSKDSDASFQINEINDVTKLGIREELLRNNIIVFAHGEYHEQLIPVTNTRKKPIFRLSTPGLGLTSADAYSLLTEPNMFRHPFAQKFLYESKSGEFSQSSHYVREIRPGEFLFDYKITFPNVGTKDYIVPVIRPDGNVHTYDAASIYIPYGYKGEHVCKIGISNKNFDSFEISWYNLITELFPYILTLIEKDPNLPGLTIKNKNYSLLDQLNNPIIFVNCGNINNVTSFKGNSRENIEAIKKTADQWNIPPPIKPFSSIAMNKGYNVLYPKFEERLKFKNNPTELLHKTVTYFIQYIYDKELLQITDPYEVKKDQYVAEVKQRKI